MILEHANVSKATLYNHFKTKDDLIAACLEHAHNLAVEEVINKIDRMEIPAREKIMKIFDTMQESVQNKDLVRCIFINASAEFSDLECPARKIATEHKICIQNYIEKLAVQARIREPAYFARICTALSEGALIMAQVSGDKGYYKDITALINRFFL